jgi:hypothetical protein
MIFAEHIFILSKVAVNLLPFLVLVQLRWCPAGGLVDEVASLSIEAVAVVDEGEAGTCFI